MADVSLEPHDGQRLERLSAGKQILNLKNAHELVARARARGPRGTARGALRLLRREAEGAVRRRQLARRPLALAPGELQAALCGDPVDLLRRRVLQALPTVAAW